MGFFTVGNILTLCISLLLIILFRYFDQNNRNLKLLRGYSDKLKNELTQFVQEQEKAVKDYAISLKVERDAAKELMKHLQITEDELAEKAAAVARLDSQIKGYENSLAELDRMTGRVQENMNRIRDESSFVETTGKRISEARTKLDDLEREISGLKEKFEKDNSESLEKTAGAVLAGVKSDVSDLNAAALGIERRVEDHRQEINKIETERAEKLSKDLEHIDRLMKSAVEEAGKRADKMEETALANLKEQAEERLLRIKSAEEEKLRNYQESAKARVTEIQDALKNIKDEWHTERVSRESADKSFQDERRKNIQDINAQLADTEKRFKTNMAGYEKQMDELTIQINEMIPSHKAMLIKAAEDMKQSALEIAGEKLEEYRSAQEEELRRLLKFADDSRNIDSELRKYMQDVISRMREDFSRYERESADAQKTETDKFTAAASALKQELADAEKELDTLRTAASESVSEKLKIFEDDFIIDLSRRSGDIDRRLVEWQENLETKLSRMGEESETSRRELERTLADQMRKTFSAHDARLSSELEKLKDETGAFEEGIRAQMNTADDSVSSYKAQLDDSLEEARKEAELIIKAEISKNSITAAETVKQYQRDLDLKLQEMSDYIQSRNGEISGLMETSRTEFSDARDGLASKVRELDDTIEDSRRRVRELAAETDNRIATVRSSVDDAERHIRDAIEQTRALDRAEELKRGLERRIEDLKAEIERVDQRRAEVAQLDNDFIKIRRLEDDVNAKMTRFLSEKRRLDAMEADFSRLLQISKSVEEKLSQVTVSDDTLQGIQLQIRKLEEALAGADEKYQRMERKSQILENTNESIDRNFRLLQESEKTSIKIGGDLGRYAEDLKSISASIEKLAAESDRAREAADLIEMLNNDLEETREQINSVQKARRWIADAEKRLEDLNKDLLTQVRTADSVAKGKGKGSLPDLGDGAPPQQKKENVIALARQGWTVKEIAKALKMAQGEVELILEMMPRD